MLYNFVFLFQQVRDCYIYCGSADGLVSIYKWSSDESCLRRQYESSDAKCSNGSLAYHRGIHCIAVSADQVYYGDDGMNIKVLHWKKGIRLQRLACVFGL
jgi:hypothetical protein